jgi:hypothetical protein
MHLIIITLLIIAILTILFLSQKSFCLKGNTFKLVDLNKFVKSGINKLELKILTNNSLEPSILFAIQDPFTVAYTENNSINYWINGKNYVLNKMIPDSIYSFEINLEKNGNNKITIGGSPEILKIDNKILKNYQGCLENIKLNDNVII